MNVQDSFREITSQLHKLNYRVLNGTISAEDINIEIASIVRECESYIDLYESDASEQIQSALGLFDQGEFNNA